MRADNNRTDPTAADGVCGFYLYRADSPDGMRYIGQTTQPPAKRFADHRSRARGHRSKTRLLAEKIRKFGNLVRFSVISEHASQADLDRAEQEAIAAVPEALSLNLTSGALECECRPAAKAQMRAAQRKR